MKNGTFFPFMEETITVPPSLPIVEEKTNTLNFRTNAYMQVPNLALQVHLKNLIATFGGDAVKDVMRVLIKE